MRAVQGIVHFASGLRLHERLRECAELAAASFRELAIEPHEFVDAVAAPAALQSRDSRLEFPYAVRENAIDVSGRTSCLRLFRDSMRSLPLSSERRASLPTARSIEFVTFIFPRH